MIYSNKNRGKTEITNTNTVKTHLIWSKYCRFRKNLRVFAVFLQNRQKRTNKRICLFSKKSIMEAFL